MGLSAARHHPGGLPADQSQLRARGLGERLQHDDLPVDLGGVAGDDEVAGLHRGAFPDVHAGTGAELGEMQRREPGLEDRATREAGQVAEPGVSGPERGDGEEEDGREADGKRSAHVEALRLRRRARARRPHGTASAPSSASAGRARNCR